MDLSVWFEPLFEVVDGFKGFTMFLSDVLAIFPSIFVTCISVFFIVVILAGLVAWLFSLL